MLRSLCAALFAGAAVCTQSVSAAEGGLPIPDRHGANQGAFPFYYGTGLPDDDDLVEVNEAESMPPPSSSAPFLAAPIPEAPFPPASLNNAGRSGTPQSPPAEPRPSVLAPSPAEREISRTRAALGLVRSYCENGETEQALAIFQTMPPFGDNIILNALRTDAAGLLILDYCRSQQFTKAGEIYRALPGRIPGEGAMLARGRSTLNLATYYVMAGMYGSACSILEDLSWLDDISPLQADLITLLVRMIPYLDSAGEMEKAAGVYALLLQQVNSVESAEVFADNFIGLQRYYFNYLNSARVRTSREERLDTLQTIFESLADFTRYPDIALLRQSLAENLIAFCTEKGYLERARYIYENMSDIRGGMPPRTEEP